MTIRDVAKKANVSITTVSRVLNGDAKLSVTAATRNMVLSVAEELQYRPRKKSNEGAVGAVGLTAAIVLMVDESLEPVRPFLQQVRLSVERYLSDNGVSVKIVRRVNQAVHDRGLDGLFVVGPRVPPEVYAGFNPARVVFVDDSPDSSRFNSVVIDFQAALRLAVEHLVALGHTDIGFIGGMANYEEERIRSYRAVMMEKHLYRPGREFLGDWWPQDGYEAMKKAIFKGNMPTAFYVATDPLAVGAMAALHEAGLQVPEDVSIVSFDDAPTAQFLKPPLTTIKAYPDLMGELAVELFLDSLRGRTTPLKITVPPLLVIRGTTGRPRESE